MNFASIRKFSLPVASALLSSFLLSGIAKANISISPMVVETEVKRGQAQGRITVSNTDAEDFRARVYTSPFTYDKETGFKTLSESPKDLTPYLQFSPRELQVGGSRKRNIRFIVRFPPSLPDGEYRTMIFTENLQKGTITETDSKTNVTLQTNIIPRIGVALYVRKGDVSPDLSFPSVRVNPKTNQIQLLVNNKGKASAIVAGDWKLKKGKEVIQKGNISDTTVLAEGERYVVAKSLSKNQSKLAPGEYQLTGELGWGVNKKNRVPFTVNVTIPGR
ncbi:hypothetical protein NIES267_18240 [Calothrix parasitica NIES-267]|uniref:P pilus assembly protein, chaperone PapD n=1 Tax=Calothrix parasitica NIES-267 TaxID=1973488 RepID=A0A1Z4LM90_9CYAN|nr:hypothetical protein NIES267_18240 [Calothrix parasitica NIES-267]